MEASQMNIAPTAAKERRHHFYTSLDAVRTLFENDPIEDLQTFFHIPYTIEKLITIYGPDTNLTTLLGLLSEFYTSKMVQGEHVTGWLFGVDKEAGIVSKLTEFLQSTYQPTEVINLNIGEMLDAITRDMDELLRYRFDPSSAVNIGDYRTAPPADAYMLACAIHPQIDSQGLKAKWLKRLYERQPEYFDDIPKNRYQLVLDAKEKFPALTCLLRESLRVEGEDFVQVFEVFGKWCLLIVMGGISKKDPQENEDAFIEGLTGQVDCILAPVSLYVRKAICRIDLRPVYRTIKHQAEAFLELNLGTSEIEVLCHRLFRWILACALSSDFAPEDKIRISTWLQHSGLDRVLSTNYPINIILPGQKEVSWWHAPFGSISDTADEGTELDLDPHDEELKDIEFNATGPPLNPLQYASNLNTKHADEVCSICQDDLANGCGNALMIDTCGHLAHEQCLSQLINGIDEWSNKCTICRQKICAPRERHIIIEDDDEEARECNNDEGL